MGDLQGQPPLPSPSLSTFPFFRASPPQVEEPWTFSVAPSTMVAMPLPWISKGSPLSPPSPSPLSLSSGLLLLKLKSPGPSVWRHPPWWPRPCPGSPRAAPSPFPPPLHSSSLSEEPHHPRGTIAPTSTLFV